MLPSQRPNYWCQEIKLPEFYISQEKINLFCLSISWCNRYCQSNCKLFPNIECSDKLCSGHTLNIFLKTKMSFLPTWPENIAELSDSLACMSLLDCTSYSTEKVSELLTSTAIESLSSINQRSSAESSIRIVSLSWNKSSNSSFYKHIYTNEYIPKKQINNLLT